MSKDKVESRTWTEVGQQEKEACDRIYKQFGSLHAFFEYIKTHPETLKVARPSVPQQGQARELIISVRNKLEAVVNYKEYEGTFSDMVAELNLALAASRSEEATASWDDATKMADVMKAEVGELTSEICETVESLFADNGAYDQIKSILSKSLAKHYDYEFKLIHSIPSMMQKAERESGAPAAGSAERLDAAQAIVAKFEADM